MIFMIDDKREFLFILIHENDFFCRMFFNLILRTKDARRTTQNDRSK